MSDIYFKCECGKSLAVDEAGIGRTVSCVDCGRPVVVPNPDFEFVCEGCGAALLAPLSISGDKIKCASCGRRMQVPSVIQSKGEVRRPGEPIREGEKGSAGGFAPPAGQSSGVNAPPASDASRVMNDLMRRRREFVIRRAPARRSPWAKTAPSPEPVLSGRLFRLALAAIALIVVGEVMRAVFRHDASDSVSEEGVTARQEEIRETFKTAIASFDDVEGVSMTAVIENEAAEGARIPAAAQEIELKSVDEAHASPKKIEEANRKASESSPLETGEVTEPRRGAEIAREDKELRTLREKAASLPPGKEKHDLLREILFKEKVPELREIITAAQKLNGLVNYRTGWNQSDEFFDALERNMEQIKEYTLIHGGKDLDSFYWSTSYSIIYGHAIRTARSYREAEKILREGWAMLERAESSDPRAIPRTILSMGVNMAHDRVTENPFECAVLMDELEEMKAGMKDEYVGDIWRVTEPYLRTRFVKYAGNVPEDQRKEFVRRHRDRLEKDLMDEAISLHNRAAILRGWVTFLDKHGKLTDALPIIRAWQEKYGEELEMDYYFARLWVELYGEGDWEKARETVEHATELARKGGKIFDWKEYRNVVGLYYDLRFLPGDELKRQRTIRNKSSGNEGMKPTLNSGTK